MWQFVKEIFATKYCFAPSWTGSWIEGIHCLLPFPYPSCEPGKPCLGRKRVLKKSFKFSRVPRLCANGDVLLMPLRSENSYCRILNPLSWFNSEEMPLPRLLVVGSGPAGIQIVRNLYKDFQVILVEPKDWCQPPKKWKVVIFDEAKNWKEFFSIFFGQDYYGMILHHDSWSTWWLKTPMMSLEICRLEIEVSKFSFLGPSWGSPKLDGCTFPPLNSRITRTTMSLLQESYVVFAMQSI